MNINNYTDYGYQPNVFAFAVEDCMWIRSVYSSLINNIYYTENDLKITAFSLMGLNQSYTLYDINQILNN